MVLSALKFLCCSGCAPTPGQRSAAADAPIVETSEPAQSCEQATGPIRASTLNAEAVVEQEANAENENVHSNKCGSTPAAIPSGCCSTSGVACAEPGGSHAAGISCHPVSCIQLTGLEQLSNSGRVQKIVLGKQPLAEDPAAEDQAEASGACNMRLLQQLKDLQWLGQGGGGIVYKGQWQGVQVAVKFMVTSDESLLQEALREGMVSRTVGHPCVVHTYAALTLQITAEMVQSSQTRLVMSNAAASNTTSTQSGTPPLHTPSTHSGAHTTCAAGAGSVGSGTHVRRRGVITLDQLARQGSGSTSSAHSRTQYRSSKASSPDQQQQQQGQQQPAGLQLGVAQQPAQQQQPAAGGPIQPRCSRHSSSTEKSSSHTAVMTTFGDIDGRGEGVLAAGITLGDNISTSDLNTLFPSSFAAAEGSTPSNGTRGVGAGSAAAGAGGLPPELSSVLTALQATAGQFLTVLIMEYCNGGTLLKAIKDGSFERVDGSRAKGMLGLLRSAHDVALGCHHLHSLNIVHGDLKPTNVLLMSKRISCDSELQCKVSDFGLARQHNSSGSGEGEAPGGDGSVLHNNEGHGWGTVAYMAPELLDGRRCKASDVHAFGVILYQMLTKEPPYASLTVPQILFGVKVGTLQLKFPDWCPSVIRKLGESCLNRDPAERPSFEHIAKVLKMAADHLDKTITSSALRRQAKTRTSPELQPHPAAAAVVRSMPLKPPSVPPMKPAAEEEVDDAFSVRSTPLQLLQFPSKAEGWGPEGKPPTSMLLFPEFSSVAPSSTRTSSTYSSAYSLAPSSKRSISALTAQLTAHQFGSSTHGGRRGSLPTAVQLAASGAVPWLGSTSSASSMSNHHQSHLMLLSRDQSATGAPFCNTSGAHHHHHHPHGSSLHQSSQPQPHGMGLPFPLSPAHARRASAPSGPQAETQAEDAVTLPPSLLYPMHERQPIPSVGSWAHSLDLLAITRSDDATTEAERALSQHMHKLGLDDL